MINQLIKIRNTKKEKNQGIFHSKCGGKGSRLPLSPFLEYLSLNRKCLFSSSFFTPSLNAKAFAMNHDMSLIFLIGLI